MVVTLSRESSNREIFTESIKNGNPFNSIFLSLDQVSAIVHSPIGNYVATLEGRPGEKGAAVRIYCNW